MLCLKAEMWAALRKYRSGHSDLPISMWSLAALLRVVGLRIDRNAKLLSVFSYILTGVCALCYIYSCQVSMVWFVLVRCRETGDLLAATVAFSNSSTSLIGIVKLLYMYMYSDKVQEMVAACFELDKLPVAPASRAVLAASQRTVMRRVLAVEIIVVGNGVIYILQPLFKSGRHLMHDGQVLFGLEPVSETPNYEIALVTLFMSEMFILYVVAVITALFMIIIGYSEGRLLALSEEVKPLWHDALHHYKEIVGIDYREGDKDAATELNRYIRHRLQGIVENHAANANLVNRLKDVFSGAITIEFILLIVSLIAALLVGFEKAFILVPFASIQVIMDCFTGQKLMDANEALENAVYDCKWENFDAYNRKIVQVMLHTSQKTLNVSAGGVITLSFSTLMSVIKFVYSAYTGLRSTMH